MSWPPPGGQRPQGEPALDGQQEIAADQGQPVQSQDLDVDHDVAQGGGAGGQRRPGPRQGQAADRLGGGPAADLAGAEALVVMTSSSTSPRAPEGAWGR